MITGQRTAVPALALSAALTATLLGAGAGPAAADGEPADEPQRPAPKVELMLDVSGSMRANDIDGRSRMAAAKQAFNEVLDATPDDVELGIRTLGANYRGN